jgi:hypothetical protein
MKLKDAYALLHESGNADHHRNFAMIFKHYNFDDDTDLKDYLDFVESETLEWYKGFPAGFLTKEQLGKPKTALIKLLKAADVKTALGAEYVAKVHKKVWDTFKHNVESIAQERMVRAVHEQPTVVSCSPPPPQETSLSTEDFECTGVYRIVPLQPERPTPTGTFEKHPEPPKTKTDAERIQLLKDVLSKMAETLPAGASDAVRLLVSHV